MLNEYRDNPKTVYLFKEYDRLSKQIEEIKGLILQDQSLRELSEEELEELEKNRQTVLGNIKEIIESEKEGGIKINEVILEVRAGAGGDEASLFAFELAEMYRRYSEKRG